LAAALIKPSLIPEPFLQSFLPIPALSAILAGVGIMDTVQRGGRRPRALLALTASSIAMAGWMISPEGISTEHLPSPRWIPPLVLVVVAAGSSRSRLRMAAVISGAALLAGLTVDSLSGLRSNRHQLAMVQWVTETVGDDETFLDGWTGFGTLRNHAYQFFSPHVGIRRMMTADEKDDRVVEILLANPPRLLAADGALQSLSPRVSRIIEERYRWTGKAVFWEPRPPGEIGTPAERKVAPKGQKKRDRTWLQRAAPMVPTPTPKPAQPTGKPSRPSKGHL